jgi:hypothetical protein
LVDAVPVSSVLGPEITVKVTSIPSCGVPDPSVMVAVTVWFSPSGFVSVGGVSVIRKALFGVGIQFVKLVVDSSGSVPIPVFHAVETGFPPHFM